LILIDDRDWRLVERLGQRICRGRDRARKRKGGYASALLGFEPKDGFSYEIRSGHCRSDPISDGRARSLARRICKATWLQNIAKGIRRIDVLCDGDLEGTKHFLDVLPQALETSAETVKLALDQTVREIELAEKQEAEARDRIWRENFCPHAIILTERTVPSPIFVAAIIGVEKLHPGKLGRWISSLHVESALRRCVQAMGHSAVGTRSRSRSPPFAFGGTIHTQRRGRHGRLKPRPFRVQNLRPTAQARGRRNDRHVCDGAVR
jgi:hypothetical protein